MTEVLAPRAAARVAAATRPRQDVVHVRIGEIDVGIPIDHVVQALAMPSRTGAVLPRRNDPLVCMLEDAGHVVPVIDVSRWVPTGPAAADAQPRVLMLRHAGRRVGVCVDAVHGVKSVDAGAARRVHQVPDPQELFESVLPSSSTHPSLMVLEVERLMRLAATWCEEADCALAADSPITADALAARTRWAVLRIGQEQWAVPASNVQRIVPAVVPELRFNNGRGGGLGQWDGRKIALVEMAGTPLVPSPWMAIVDDGRHELALGVTACTQMVDLAGHDIVDRPDDPMLAGVAFHPELGALKLLAVNKLFTAVPEAVLRHRLAPARRASAGTAGDADAGSCYIVFDSGHTYAAAASTVIAVVPLDAAARAEIAAGHRATVRWRARSVDVLSLPAIDESSPAEPRLAMLIQSDRCDDPPIGIAIHALVDLVPAAMAKRSSMHMHAVGTLAMISVALDGAARSIMVMDLKAMAHLLG